MYFNLYYYKKWWYKALTVLMILAIIVFIAVAPVQKARAVGVLTATMGAAILAVLAGAGVYTVVSGMTWNEISDWLTTRLNAWDTFRNDGQTWDQLLTNNKVGATVSGFLKIEYELASNICEFVSWLVNNNLQLSNNSTITVQSTAPYQLSDYFDFTYNDNNDIDFTVTGNTISVIDYSKYYRTITLNPKANIESYSFVADGYINIKNNASASSFVLGSSNDSTFTNLVNCYLSQSGVSVYSSYKGSTTRFSYSVETPKKIFFGGYINDVVEHFSIQIRGLTINGNSVPDESSNLTINSDVIGIPDVDTDSSDIIINPGAYPGATTEQVTDVIIDGIVENTLDVNMEVTNEFTDAQAVVVTNTLPISVNTDHHMFGFTLPSFDVNFVSIWHYVHDAITYSSGYIAHFVGMLNSVPVLAIPVYMSFTLLIVLGFIRKVL